MSRVCEACGRTATAGEAPWEVDVLPDGSVGVVCPACLERMTRQAEDEGRIWTALAEEGPDDPGDTARS